MPQVSPTQILEKLRTIKVLDQKNNIVDLGLVSEIFVEEGKVHFSISVAPVEAKNFEPVRRAAEKVIHDMEGVTKVLAVLTAHKDTPDSSPKQGKTDEYHDSGSCSVSGKKRQPHSQIKNIDKIIAIASGKGGVGKSTTTVNLALALKAKGLRIGILDADIHGPSVPHLTGTKTAPKILENQLFEPLETHGVKMISMGLLVGQEVPVIWRGPMISSALMRMLHDVHWGELDILLIDMPPGTGDISLTVAQKIPLSGVVAISTPQDLALLDVRKSINAFHRLNVPILGLVENMSYFCCPSCGEKAEIFGHGNVRKESQETGECFLGEIPLDIRIRQCSDTGLPAILEHPDGIVAASFLNLAQKVLERLKLENSEVGESRE